MAESLKRRRSFELALTRHRVSFADLETFPKEEMKRMQRLFRTFRQPHTAEVLSEDVYDILMHLGYFCATEQEVNEMVQEISEFSTMDFQEVLEVAEHCAMRERELLDWAFEKRCIHGYIPRSSLAEALQLLHVAVPLETVIEEVLMQVGLEEKDELGRNDFMHFLAAFRVAEGLRQQEVARAREIFQGFTGGTAAKGAEFETESLREMRTVQLRPALVTMFSVHCGEHVAHVLEKLTALADSDEDASSDGENSGDAPSMQPQGIDFREFLVLCRCVKTTIVSELQEDFTHHNVDGLLPTDALASAMVQLGFTLLPSAFEEFRVMAGLSAKSDLNLEGFLDFVHKCRQSSGFQNTEVERLSAVFAQHDHKAAGTVASLRLLDILRYLGYTVSLADVRGLLARVDPKASSTAPMNQHEFLRRMRMFREEELRALYHAFMAHCDANRALGKDNAKAALPGHNTELKLEAIAAGLRSQGDPLALSFEAFVRLADHCREQMATEKRRRAGFSEASYKHICRLFDKHRKKELDALGKGELLWFLIEIAVPVSTGEERAAIFGMIETARESALQAGVSREDLGDEGDTFVTIWALLHLLRLVMRDGESKNVEREERAMDDTGFLRVEIEEFRRIFTQWVRRTARLRTVDHTKAVGQGRRGSMPPSMYEGRTQKPGAGPPQFSDVLAADEREGRLTLEALEMLLDNMGLQVDHKQAQVLKARVAQIAEEDDNTLDFADFLVLMRWMLDADFANIKEQTEQFKTAGLSLVAAQQSSQRRVPPMARARRGSV